MDTASLLANAQQYQQSGQWHLARYTYQQVLEQDSQNIDAWNNIGIALQNLNRIQEAMDAYSQAYALAPGRAEVLHNIGNLLQSNGQLQEAVGYYEQALLINPHIAATQCNLAMLKQAAGNWDAALRHYTQACLIDPAYWMAQYNLAVLYKERQNYAAAVSHFLAMLSIKPDFCDALSNLGSLYQDQGRLDEASIVFQQSLQYNPQHLDSRNNWGSTLHHMGHLSQAIEQFKLVLQSAPDNSLVMNNLAVVLSEAGRYDESREAFAKTIAQHPDYADPWCFMGFIDLIQGKFKAGWDLYEWRTQVQAYIAKNNPARYTQPKWDGGDLNGKTIMVYAEQGFGDTMQFSRFLPLVRQKNPGKVIFQLQAGLKRLFANREDNFYDELVHQFEPIPPHDVCIPLMSLPRLFGLYQDHQFQVPVPYLFPLSSDLEKHASRFIEDGSLKIGLVWAGDKQNRGNRNRSTVLAQYAALATIPNLTFYSLQIGPPNQEALSPPAGMRLIDLSDILMDFADTAAVIQKLDLLISVDTSVVHLAGAMGKPVWTLLGYTPDWRWQLNRPDSPWYPTMRLFRQPAYRDWDSVFDTLYKTLLDYCHAFFTK